MFDPKLWGKRMELSLGAVASLSWGCCAVGHCCSQVVLRMTGTRAGVVSTTCEPARACCSGPKSLG